MTEIASDTTALASPHASEAGGPSWQRLEDQIAWYERTATRDKRSFQATKTVQVLTAAAIPVAAAASAAQWILGALGAFVLVLEALQQLFQFQRNWIAFRSTAEALKHERQLFLAAAGPYRDRERSRGRLAERVEGLVSQEHAAWVSLQIEDSREDAYAGEARALGGSLATAVADSLPEAIVKGFELVASGPQLVNFDGRVEVLLLDDSGVDVAKGVTGPIPWTPSRPYSLLVAIARGPGQRGVPLRITDGVERSTVDFTVTLDSDDRALRQSATVTMAADASRQTARFRGPLFTDEGGPSWLWVRISQERRVVQSMELVFASTPDATE